jgi:hypothetical protein
MTLAPALVREGQNLLCWNDLRIERKRVDVHKSL